MVCTFVGIALLQVEHPAQAVAGFVNLKSPQGGYVVAATSALNVAIAQDERFAVVPMEAASRSAKRLGLTAWGPVEASRFGVDVRATTVLAGEILAYRVERTRTGRRARAAVRVIAYDTASGLTVGGAVERGESRLGGSDEARTEAAIREAVEAAARTMRNQRLPSGRMVVSAPLQSSIDVGSEEGFKVGDRFVVSRGFTEMCTGRIAATERNTASVTIDRSQSYVGLAPGDRVRKVYDPPALPKDLRKTLDGEIEGIRKQPPARWIVAEFRDPRRRSDGRRAADAVAEALARADGNEPVSRDEAKAAADRLGITFPSTSLLSLQRVGHEVKASTVLAGIVGDSRIDEARGGRRAHVELRVVAYDAETGFPEDGAKVWAEAETHGDEAAEQAAISAAYRRAATNAVGALLHHHVPTAKVTKTAPLRVVIDHGAHEGFKLGDEVTFQRGWTLINVGRVRAMRASEAEVSIGESTVGIALGDRVRKIYDVPFEPPYPSP